MKSLSSSTRITSLSLKTALRFALPALVLPILVPAETAEARPARNRVVAAPVPQAWPGKRVLLVLPLRTGENWKANPEFTQAFLPQAQTALREALGRTNKFSLLEVRRFNAVLTRAVQDGAATNDDLNSLLSQPTVPAASVFLAKTSFNRAPLQSFSVPATIGSFVLESVEQTSAGLRLKVTGRMYEPGSLTAMRALSATVTVPTAATEATLRTPSLTAATVGFDRVLMEFVRYPTEREIPIMPVAEVVVATPVAVETTTTTTTTTSGVVLPGTPIAGASSRPLTADGRASTATTTTTMSATTTTMTPVFPGMMVAPGITVEVETPPAEIFPTAPAPSGTGGGDGTDTTAGTEEGAEATTEETAVVDETAPAVEDATGDSTSDTGDAPADATSEEAVPDAPADDSAMTDDTATEEAATDDTSSGDANSATPEASPASGVAPGGDEIVAGGSMDMVGDEIAPEDVLSGEIVTTTVSSRVRNRVPGEEPAFER